MATDIPDEDADVETTDRSIDEVKSFARSLGFTLKPQDEDDYDEGVGYFVLVSTAGDQPLGPDAVSTTDVVRFLNDHAIDLGEDVDDEIDINAHLKKQKPPPGATKKAAAILKAHKPHRDEPDVDPLTAEKIRDHNAQVIQDRLLKRTNQSTALYDPEAEEDGYFLYDPADDVPVTGAFLPPEPGEYDPAPKAAAGFAVAAKTGRTSRAELAKRKALLDCKAEIKAALAEKPKDQIKLGRFLTRVKGLLGHGGLEQWVADELCLSIRTAQGYMKAAKMAQPSRESASF
jgi:hypothetical protein